MEQEKDGPELETERYFHIERKKRRGKGTIMSEKVLAVAAGHEITEGELNELIRKYPQEQQVYLSNPNARAQVLEQLIAFHLFAKMADEEKITETEEYKTTMESMKVELKSHMAATKSIEKAKVTEEEEKAYYEAHKAQFVQEPQVKARHILVDTEEMANRAAQEIAEGKKNFAAAAEEYSTCPSKEQGGDLGYFTKGQMVKEFEKAAFEGEMNKVIGPVKTQFGYHLILVEDKKEGSEMAFAQVQGQIYQQLLTEKQREAYDSTVAELAKKYGVEKR